MCVRSVYEYFVRVSCSDLRLDFFFGLHWLDRSFIVAQKWMYANVAYVNEMVGNTTLCVAFTFRYFSSFFLAALISNLIQETLRNAFSLL